MRRDIPFVKYGGLRFLEAAHVKDLLAVLRFADNPRNRIAAFRMLQLLPGMGPANAARLCDEFESGAFHFARLLGMTVPAGAREAWAHLSALLLAIGGAETPWAGQLARVRAWYEPQLERLYEQPAPRRADLEQLERIALQYATRRDFVTELTLDPPQATGDLAGAPLLDEDYLILSTVHSAKGQEWESVYVLNVTDGSFPSEFATGRAESIDEERRLLYVAMTRAKRDLHLVAPLRFYVTQQSPVGDRYVMAARSRFLSAPVLARLDELCWPAAPEAGGEAGSASRGSPIDVGARLRAMW
jgi:ATP-dependent DNA helicase UvrD/PcrA